MKKSRCVHNETKPGPRVWAVYGSWETEVCRHCGKYRVNHHYWSKWKTGPVPKQSQEDKHEGD